MYQFGKSTMLAGKRIVIEVEKREVLWSETPWKRKSRRLMPTRVELIECILLGILFILVVLYQAGK